MLFRMPFSVLLVAALLVGAAQATAVYTYKKGEYPIIADGLAPDGAHSIAAHGEGEDGSEDFHLYLFAEPGHKKIGVLEEVRQVLDTAPHGFNAIWSPDSRYVVLLHRSDRRVLALNFYRIEHRRAFPIDGPTLLDIVVGGMPEDSNEAELRARTWSVTWLGGSRFRLEEQGTVRTTLPELVQKIERYGKVEHDAPRSSEGASFIEYSISAECEIAGSSYSCSRLRSDG